MLAHLARRERTGKKIPIKLLLPLRKTKSTCIRCSDNISGVIVDLFEDMDIWDFRYHYFIPWHYCHNCKDPIRRI